MKTLILGTLLAAVVLWGTSDCRAEDPWQVTSLESGRYTQEDADLADRPPRKADSSDDEQRPEEHPRHSIAHQVLLYLPNRLLDVLDIVRVRVRVGPGVAASVRATKYVQAYLGAYGSVYGGLPGPRMRPMPRSPLGLEDSAGLKVSVFDATVDGGFGPDYSPTEVGAGVQLAILGFDVGIDPWEIVDFVGGILTFDVREDDL